MRLPLAGTELEVPYFDPATGGQRSGAMLTVERPILQLGGKLHEEDEAKTNAANRKVFLDADTAELLREHRRAQLKARMKAGEAWQDRDLVFCQDDGRPWNPDHVTRRFERLAIQAGVPKMSLHEGGRHTARSLMGDAEISEDISMREVGHQSREIDQRYNHPAIQRHLAAAEVVAAQVRKAGGAP